MNPTPAKVPALLMQTMHAFLIKETPIKSAQELGLTVFKEPPIISRRQVPCTLRMICPEASPKETSSSPSSLNSSERLSPSRIILWLTQVSVKRLSPSILLPLFQITKNASTGSPRTGMSSLPKSNYNLMLFGLVSAKGMRKVTRK